jgi:hypothetical protein
MPQLLREYYALCPDGACQIGLLTEDEKRAKESGATFLTGIMQVCEQKNQNGRIYKLSTLQREMKLYQKLVDERRSLGTLDHGEESEILLKESSHMVTRFWWEGNKLLGVIKLLSTPNGNIAKSLIESSVQLGVSSRALGSLQESPQGSIVGEDLQIISYDLVANPSVSSAFLSLTESRKVRDSVYTKQDRIDRAFYNVLGD